MCRTPRSEKTLSKRALWSKCLRRPEIRVNRSGGLRSWLDHMSACSPSLPHWPILSSLLRKKSSRSFWAPGVQTLNWISQRKFHRNRNTVRTTRAEETALNTGSLYFIRPKHFLPNGRHHWIHGHLEVMVGIVLTKGNSLTKVVGYLGSHGFHTQLTYEII